MIMFAHCYRICSKPDDGNIISNYILYEGKYSNAIKLKRVKGQFDPVCIDINELSPDVIYIGQYMLSSGSKKEYYGFSIIRSGVRILSNNRLNNFISFINVL